ncbi:MAG: threonylcarbamoyl-AMP synthase, partial [Acidaminococcaceae bacterium]|nr:threonylcarbamoyl-AMP synthase [Acidaminococcaceae bacterium]
TDAQAVWDDMQGKIAGIIDGGSCGIGVESTVVDTTAAVPIILRPGGITREMLEAVLGAVEVDPALAGQGDFKPKAPGMKYRHYAPQAAMYLFEGAAAMQIPAVAAKAAAQGIRTGVLCSEKIAAQLPQAENMLVSAWGQDTQALAEKLYSLLRGFDKQQAELIVAEGVGEDGLGLAVMNRLRKAAGYQIVTVSDGRLCAKSGTLLPEFMLK